MEKLKKKMAEVTECGSLLAIYCIPKIYETLIICLQNGIGVIFVA